LRVSRNGISGPSDVLRGEAPGAFELRPAKGVPGGVELSWAADPQADGYAIVFLGPDLVEMARVAVGPDTSLTLRAGTLPAGLAAGAMVSVEVESLRDGVLVATTPARTIRLP